MSTDTPAQWRMVPVEPTPEMVAAYLTANSTYWREMDEGPEPIGRWRNGTPAEATVESYRAMLAAAPQPAQEPPNYAGPKDCPDEAWDLALKVRADLDRISCPGVYMDKAVEAICKRWSAATTQAAPAPTDPLAPPEVLEAIERGEFEPGQWTVSATRAIEQNPHAALAIIKKLRDRKVAPVAELVEALRALLDEQDAQQGYATPAAYDRARAALSRAPGAGMHNAGTKPGQTAPQEQP